MAAYGYARPGQSEPQTEEAVTGLLRGVANGEPIEWLLGAGAREMMRTANADRVGLWLLSSGEQGNLEGTVVQVDTRVPPDHWRRLDPHMPAIRSLMRSGTDEIFLTSIEPTHRQLELLAGTARALCIPLRVKAVPIGLAIIAWRSDAVRPDPLPLRALADAVALAASGRFAGERHQPWDLSETTKALFTRVHEAEAQLASVAESTDSGIVLFDSQGNPRLVNDRFAQMLGTSRQVISEVRTWDALAAVVSDHFRDPVSFRGRWEQLAPCPSEASWDELELLRPARRILERFVRPVRDAEGKYVGRLETYRDVTSERLVQTKLLQTEKLAAIGQMISGIAHELNNPLTSIMGYSQLLLGRRLSVAQAADGRLIYQEAERAARIVKNLLLFARDTRPERRSVNLNEIVERTLTLRNYELRVENIELEQNLAADLPPVDADPAQLQQVLLNLIVNAEQAIRHGRGEGSIRIRTWCKLNGRVGLEIADNGPGIPADIIPRIFDPFFSTKPAGKGTGLGLSITFGIIRDHGGEIAVESQAGKGAKFILELPAGKSAAPAPILANPVRGPGLDRLRATQAERVLVIEDEPTIAHLIADVLGEEGHPVEIVLEGKEGLRRALGGQYDLIICDLRMPGVDGRAIYKELEAKGSPLLQRLIFLTGDTLASRTLEFLESSSVPYMGKPFLVEELKALVARVLEAPHHLDEGSRFHGVHVHPGNRIS